VTARPIEGLTTTANFGWNNLHFNKTIISGGAPLFFEGQRPNDSPEYTAGLAAEYSAPLGASGVKGFIGASGNYISSLNSTEITSGATAAVGGNSLVMTRADAGLRFPNHIDVSLFVDNANNYHGSQEPQQGVPQWSTRVRPRTYGIRFDYHLK
jgi:hypothetical protein